MLLKLLQTSMKYREKAQQVKEQYEDGFKSFVEREPQTFESDCRAKLTTECEGNVNATWCQHFNRV